MTITRKSTLGDVAAVVAGALDGAGISAVLTGYHWSDRQSLDVAVEIALANPVNMRTIKRWSQTEGALEQFDEFRRQVARKSQGGRPR
jgi:hypothetical protein